jgi:nucleoside-diphosphate-sugar epimerase
MKVLVTGATGYLGAVAAEALATRVHEVSGLARSDQAAFVRDGEAVRAIQEALTDHGGALIFGRRRKVA